MWMTPFLTPTYPLVSDLMVSTMSSWKPCLVEQKLLVGTLKMIFQNGFENFGKVGL
jgi:hypothetical protein